MASIQARLDSKGYNHIAGLHGAPNWYCWHNQRNPRTTIQARLFLPCHRAYLWSLEQALQDVDEIVSLPWWDWTNDRGIPDAYAAATVGGQSNLCGGFACAFRAQPSTRPLVETLNGRPERARLADWRQWRKSRP